MGSIPRSERSPEGNGNPLQCSCLENPIDRGAWQATVHRIAKSRTQLKWITVHAHLNSPLQSLVFFMYLSAITAIMPLNHNQSSQWLTVTNIVISFIGLCVGETIQLDSFSKTIHLDYSVLSWTWLDLTPDWERAHLCSPGHLFLKTGAIWAVLVQKQMVWLLIGGDIVYSAYHSSNEIIVSQISQCQNRK